MKTLIIRSASLERLDALVENLKGEPGELHLLTHPHMEEPVKRFYPELLVIPYPFPEGFDQKLVASIIDENGLEEEYDRAIVLCSNLSGKGHENVVETAYFFSPDVRLFNINGEFLKADPVATAETEMEKFILFPFIWAGVFSAWALGGLALLTAVTLKSLGLIKQKG